MSKQACDLIIGLLLRDSQFREEFEHSRKETLDAFDLTSQERTDLLGLEAYGLNTRMNEMMAQSRDADTLPGCG